MIFDLLFGLYLKKKCEVLANEPFARVFAQGIAKKK